MIKVNDYIEIAFYKWLLNNKVNIDILKNEQEINKLIESYLYENTKKWGIRLFIKLFQDYTLYESRDLDELDLGKQFRSFCLNESSLIYVIPESIDKQVRLQPYMSGFVNYLKEMGSYEQINNTLLKNAQSAYDKNLGLEWWFKQAIRDISEDLVRNFDIYQGNTLTYNVFQNYVLWLRSKSQSVDFVTHEVHNLGINERRNFLEIMVSVERVQRFIWNHGETRVFSYKMIPNGDHLLLEFLHYLEHYKLDINNNITFPLLLKHVDVFCNKYGEEHKKTLVKFVKNIKKKEHFASGIMQIFNKKMGKEFSIDRLHIPKLHGILLFPKHSNMAQFMNDYLEDIHYMTGDTMDIYYTEDDIKHNSSCYKKVKQLVYMNGDNNKFPAMLVWGKFGGAIETIVLKGLAHQEIFDVIEFLKNEIDLKPIPESIKSTIDFISDILKGKRPGINTLYDIRHSQIGSVGDNSSSTNVFKS
ncbi:hypothetical protein ABEW60_25195 [Paenibacillus jamilae]|uniref:hypothetical protein n=1 Tax=Paenibacillus jamilae TaxID=114136 RepID=UPI003D2B9800